MMAALVISRFAPVTVRARAARLASIGSRTIRLSANSRCRAAWSSTGAMRPRCAGTQERPEHEVEAAPIDERVENGLAEPACDSVGCAQLPQNQPTGDGQRDQGEDVEQTAL